MGGRVLEHLLAAGAFDRVVSIGRRTVPTTHPKLVQRVVDFAALGDLGPVNDVFCCLGTTIKRAGSPEAFRQVDHDYAVTLAQAAQRSGATQFLLVSAVGADQAARVFYSRVKGEVEADIRQLGYPCTQIFRPSLLLGERAEFRLGERIATWFAPVAGVALVGGLRRYLPVQADDVARAMVRISEEAPRGANVFEYDGIMAAARS